MMPLHILIIEEDRSFVESLDSMLRQACGPDIHIDLVGSIEQARVRLSTRWFDVCMVSNQIEGDLTTLSQTLVGPHSHRTAFIVLSDQPRKDLAYLALHKGAMDFLVKPRIDAFDLVKSIAFSIFRKARELELQMTALRDPLTGIGNRKLFDEQAQSMTLLVKRAKEQAAILFMDVDGMKVINDTHGHAVGDTLLQHISKRIIDSVRESDIVARVGGDEFAAMLPRIKGGRTVSAIERKLHHAVAQTPYTIGDLTLRVGLSCGAAMFPEDSEDVGVLIQMADQRMYDAKKRKKVAFAAMGGQMAWT